MPTPVNVPEVSYNTYFGNVGKVIWFEVSENYNYFELQFNLTLQSLNTTNIQVYNNLSAQVVWQNTYPEDVDQEQFLDYVRILNVPTVGLDQPYGIINLPT